MLWSLSQTFLSSPSSRPHRQTLSGGVSFRVKIFYFRVTGKNSSGSSHVFLESILAGSRLGPFSLTAETNGQRLPILMQCSFITVKFCRSGVRGRLSGSPLGASQAERRDGPAGLLRGNAGGEPTCRLVQVWAEIASLQVQDGGPCLLAGCQPGTAVRF